jgi:hypothetical protein
MIVRLMSEGQYRVPDDLASDLNELDRQAVQAVEGGEETDLRRLLALMGEIVRERGERFADSHLSGSDLIIPPADLSLDEARQLFTDEGLIPDLPART